MTDTIPSGEFTLRIADTPDGGTVEFDSNEQALAFAAGALLGDFGLGMSATHIRSDLGADIDADFEDVIIEGWRWSAGTQYRRQLESGLLVSAGVSLRNMGPDLNPPAGWSFAVPTGLSIGASATSADLLPIQSTVAVQYDRWMWPDSEYWRDDSSTWAGGAELLLPSILGDDAGCRDETALRFGYASEGPTRIAGWSWGGSLGLATSNGGVVAADFANVPPSLSAVSERPWQVGIRLMSGY